MVSQPDPLEQLISAHLAGEQVEVPATRRAEFEQALAAHAALQQLLTVAPSSYPEIASTDPLPPDVSARFEIQRELGRGGMGVVYLARQRSLDRPVALKVLRPGKRELGPTLERFREEAQHLAHLRHPHIVSIHEVGDAGGEPYFTMDFIDGEPLSATIARGPLPPSRAIDVLKQIAVAIQHAHRHGIIHRDLKPGNVLLDQSGHAFVTDFGLARNISRESTLTQSGELLGTPQYMAPEQARGDSSLIGESTDLHALGLLLFEMLTGRPAFASSSPADVLVKLLHETPPSLRSLDRRIPRDLDTICQKLLEKSPAARYANVSALLEDVRRYEKGEPLIARRAGSVARATRWARRHWKIAATALVTALVALAIIPPLFDRSYEELVQWGNEELASGHADTAARVYDRAWQIATQQQRRELVGSIVLACRDMEDAKAAVDLALQVFEFVPDTSFGRYDYLIAQALVARQRAQSPSGAIDIWSDKPTDDLQLVKSRLELALTEKLTPQQRHDAQQTLAAINMVLSRSKPTGRQPVPPLDELPNGSMQELETALQDESLAIWSRARAGIALGRRLEEEHRTAEAAAAYRHAYDLARTVYPVYEGVKAAMGSRVDRSDVPDAGECLLVRDLVTSLHRLSPDTFALPQGSITFEVVGFQLPPSIGIDLSLQLCAPDVQNPHQELPYSLPRLVPLRQDIPVRVGVLDGTYRLECRGNHRRADGDAQRLSRLIQIDLQDWPTQIEIHGNAVQLPPVRLRLAEDIPLISPGLSTAMDLNKDIFKWEPIAKATSYQVQLLYTTETPSPNKSYFLTVTTDQPQLRLADLSPAQQDSIRENLVAGRTGGWHVDAFDEANRCIGTSLQEGQFLVASELDTR